MRSSPKNGPSSRLVAPGRQHVEQRSYRFLTPVFGGGVHVDAHRKPYDTVTPIRIASIRGQLRFWWRACNPDGIIDVHKLAERESSVFGSTSGVSNLSVSVTKQVAPPTPLPVLENGNQFRCLKGMESLAYGAFPLRDATPAMQHGTLHLYHGEWTIELSYPEHLSEHVLASLWAWSHFGGLGGRTRRGFGAIAESSCLGGERVPDLEAGWSRFVSGVEVQWPHLQQERLSTVVIHSRPMTSGRQAQEFLLGAMRRLRQVNLGRAPGAENRPGRSYWPEPDTIRALTKQSDPKHRIPVTNVQALPRSAFGMPIITAFKDKNSDPQQTTMLPLVGANDDKPAGRFASSLILRPHQRTDGGIEAMAVVLGHARPSAVVIIGQGIPARGLPARETLSAAEAAGMGSGNRPSPMVKGNVVFTNPLLRFLEEIK